MLGYIALTAALILVSIAFILVTERNYNKYAKLKKSNADLIALYEPMRQKESLGAPAPAQIQDVSRDGAKLLETIVDVLREHDALLRGLVKELGHMAALQLDADKMLRDIVKSTHANVKIPELPAITEASKVAEIPAKSVTKPKKSKKRAAGKVGAK